MTKPIEFLRAITETKKDLLSESYDLEKDYPDWYVLTGLSQYPDTIMYANEINRNPNLDNKLKFDYLISSIRSRKRSGSWAKKEKSDADLELIQKYYGYNREKAKQALRILSQDQLVSIRESLHKGV